jgi:hypothetical protein
MTKDEKLIDAVRDILMPDTGKEKKMAQIIITLNKNDVGNLLLGGEVNVTPSVRAFNNLTGVIIKLDDYSYTKAEEVFEDD